MLQFCRDTFEIWSEHWRQSQHHRCHKKVVYVNFAYLVQGITEYVEAHTFLGKNCRWQESHRDSCSYIRKQINAVGAQLFSCRGLALSKVGYPFLVAISSLEPMKYDRFMQSRIHLCPHVPTLTQAMQGCICGTCWGTMTMVWMRMV